MRRLRRKRKNTIYAHRYYRFDGAKVTGLWLVLLRQCREHGWKGRLTGPRSGARTYAMQAALYALFRAGRGAPAFPPNGPSRHLRRNIKRQGRWTQAVDVSDPEGLIKAARKLGVSLRRPYMPREPWHVEAIKKFTRTGVKP